MTRKIIMRALYEEMTGSEISNVVDLIQLTQSPLSIYQHKLLYLTLALVLPSHPDLSLLIINSLSKDLQSDSVFMIATALSTLGHLATETMVDSLFTRVQDLLKHKSPYVRKKALETYGRFIDISPSLLQSCDYLKQRVADTDPSVMAVALSIFDQLLTKSPDQYNFLVQPILHILDQIQNAKLSPSYNDQGMPAPFIQVTCFRILSRIQNIPESLKNKVIEKVQVSLALVKDGDLLPAQVIFHECFVLLCKLESPLPSLHSWLTSSHLDQVSLGLSLLHKYNAVSEYLPRVMELSQFPDDYIQKQALECFALVLDELRAPLFLEQWLSLWKRSSGTIPDSEYIEFLNTLDAFKSLLEIFSIAKHDIGSALADETMRRAALLPSPTVFRLLHDHVIGQSILEPVCIRTIVWLIESIPLLDEGQMRSEILEQCLSRIKDATLYQERILDCLIRLCEQTKCINGEKLTNVWELQDSQDPFIKKKILHLKTLVGSNL